VYFTESDALLEVSLEVFKNSTLRHRRHRQLNFLQILAAVSFRRFPSNLKRARRRVDPYQGAVQGEGGALKYFYWSKTVAILATCEQARIVWWYGKGPSRYCLIRASHKLTRHAIALRLVCSVCIHCLKRGRNSRCTISLMWKITSSFLNTWFRQTVITKQVFQFSVDFCLMSHETW